MAGVHLALDVAHLGAAAGSCTKLSHTAPAKLRPGCANLSGERRRG